MTRLVVAAAAVASVVLATAVLPTAASARVAHLSWPRSGEAAYAVDGGRIVVGPHQRVVPIASVAKVMTAYLVLRSAPLPSGSDGFRLTVRRRDVVDTARRAAEDQSYVPVARGERLTERQALAALLLPSANNVAIMLARRVAGSVPAFVRRMNRAARTLGMRRTAYTDPSGFEPSTRSTAHDQLKLALAAMRLPAFAAMVRRHGYRIPVAGRVHNTDRLLGHHGFVGIKTGSDLAAGGCFAFRSRRHVGTTRLVITGVVLGQPGGDLIAAGLDAARRFADNIVTHTHLAEVRP